MLNEPKKADLDEAIITMGMRVAPEELLDIKLRFADNVPLNDESQIKILSEIFQQMIKNAWPPGSVPDDIVKNIATWVKEVDPLWATSMAMFPLSKEILLKFIQFKKLDSINMGELIGKMNHQEEHIIFHDCMKFLARLEREIRPNDVGNVGSRYLLNFDLPPDDIPNLQEPLTMGDEAAFEKQTKLLVREINRWGIIAKRMGVKSQPFGERGKLAAITGKDIKGEDTLTNLSYLGKKCAKWRNGVLCGIVVQKLIAKFGPMSESKTDEIYAIISPKLDKTTVNRLFKELDGVEPKNVTDLKEWLRLMVTPAPPPATTPAPTPAPAPAPTVPQLPNRPAPGPMVSPSQTNKSLTPNTGGNG